MQTFKHRGYKCDSLIHKALLKLTALNKVFLSAIVLCLALFCAPVVSATEPPVLLPGLSSDGTAPLLTMNKHRQNPRLSAFRQQGRANGWANSKPALTSRWGSSGGQAAVVSACTYTSAPPANDCWDDHITGTEEALWTAFLNEYGNGSVSHCAAAEIATSAGIGKQAININYCCTCTSPPGQCIACSIQACSLGANSIDDAACSNYF
jgi:hypothetical protein